MVWSTCGDGAVGALTELVVARVGGARIVVVAVVVRLAGLHAEHEGREGEREAAHAVVEPDLGDATNASPGLELRSRRSRRTGAVDVSSRRSWSASKKCRQTRMPPCDGTALSDADLHLRWERRRARRAFPSTSGPADYTAPALADALVDYFATGLPTEAAAQHSGGGRPR